MCGEHSKTEKLTEDICNTIYAKIFQELLVVDSFWLQVKGLLFPTN